MYIITSKTRNRIRRNPVEYGKVLAEKRQEVSSLGIGRIVPLRGTSEEKALDDVLKAKELAREKMANRTAIDNKKKEAKRKSKIRSFKESEKLYIKQKDNEAKQKVAANKIVV